MRESALAEAPNREGYGTTMNVYAKGNRAAPLWAVVGAPLVGVPLMVVLLALGAPARNAPVEELEPGVQAEQVDLQAVDRVSGGDCRVEHARSG